MKNLSGKNAILLAAALWMGMGVFLLIKGIRYLGEVRLAVMNGTQEGFSLIKSLTDYTKNPDRATLFLICGALFVGFFKGRVVLKRSVDRTVDRIRSQPDPVALKNTYSKRYLFLVGGMMCIGIAFKYLPLPLDIKGFVDFAVGAALLNGSMLYCRAAVARRATATR
ncbi:MAG: hypothetical protein AAGE99_05390 [Chlamydiota bacterium]